MYERKSIQLLKHLKRYFEQYHFGTGKWKQDNQYYGNGYVIQKLLAMHDITLDLPYDYRDEIKREIDDTIRWIGDLEILIPDDSIKPYMDKIYSMILEALDKEKKKC